MRPSGWCLGSAVLAALACVGEARAQDGGACTPGTPCTQGYYDRVCNCALAFPYPPSNFIANSNPDIGGPLDVSCSMTLDTSVYISDPSTTSLDICGQQVPAATATQTPAPGFASVVLVRVSGLTIDGGALLQIIGPYPLVIAVYGDAFIGDAGLIVGPSPDGGSAPGANLHGACLSPASANASSGAGGGAFAAVGGNGGDGIASMGGQGGLLNANDSPLLSPLVGGCSGGAGFAASGGAGGGALQISAAGRLTVLGGVLAAEGGGGAGGIMGLGGAGGGSGGGILLESTRFTLGHGAMTANGGGGGAGGIGGSSATGVYGSPGDVFDDNAAAGGVGTSTAGSGGAGGSGLFGPALAGQNGVVGSGAGGGGGSAGYLRVNSQLEGCNIFGSVISGNYSWDGAGCIPPGVNYPPDSGTDAGAQGDGGAVADSGSAGDGGAGLLDGGTSALSANLGCGCASGGVGVAWLFACAALIAATRRARRRPAAAPRP